ncbi:hypothetical protein F5882DRAFT_436724 [Hyaloscypha sp. PMI_1271]|nr:hypothetical protein F5882DRAFT_436724 [Hyaloscypha sp. PMI_1271]
MGDTYTNATVVLVVHSGSDANSGCLHTDDSRNMQLATLNASIDGITDVKVSIRNSSWSDEASSTHRIKRDISFLNRRGWIPQECPSRRLPLDNTPSGSWTSRGNSGIVYKEIRWARVGLQITQLVKVVDISRVLTTKNPPGPGKGQLSFHGTLQPVRLHWTAPRQLSEFSSVLSRSGTSIDYISLELDDGSGTEVAPDYRPYFWLSLRGFSVTRSTESLTISGMES